MASVTALAPDDAWAIGEPNWSGPGCFIDLEHWNGTRWQRLRTPRRASFGLTTQFSLPIAASSARNVWIFPGQLTNIGSSYFSYNYALHWDGRRWQRSSLPAKPDIQFAAAFDARTAWAFGYRNARLGATVGYAARFNGRSWRETTMPGTVLGFAAVAQHDMWAIGPTNRTAAHRLARQSFVAMHWNGRQWRTLLMPRPRSAGAGSSVDRTYVAASGPRNLWWSYVVDAANDTRRIGMLRWNGNGWARIAVPNAINFIDGMSQDGDGGVWLIADAEVNYNFVQYWYHYNDGRWTRQLVLTPRKYNDTMFGISWIPHTTALWSVGEADLNFGTPKTGATVGVIARYEQSLAGF
jgi:hypothetical protein